jgi:Diguanylate cyclase, GGDEF domain
MVNLDHFERFNDRYGHQTGDQPLRAGPRPGGRCCAPAICWPASAARSSRSCSPPQPSNRPWTDVTRRWRPTHRQSAAGTTTTPLVLPAWQRLTGHRPDPYAVLAALAKAGQGISRWMRRSSTTISPPTVVPPRRYGEKELQNSSDNTKPRAPATIRMIPTVLMLNPDAVTSTAKVRTAPTTSRKMLTPRLKLLAVAPGSRGWRGPRSSTTAPAWSWPDPAARSASSASPWPAAASLPSTW